MKRVGLIFSLWSTLLFTGCGNEQQQEPRSGIAGSNTVLPTTNGPPAELTLKFNNGFCNVKTLVRSTGAGTDMSVNGIAHALFDHQFMVSPVINDLFTQAWGREGEYAICAQVLEPTDRPILEAELNQLVTNFTGTIRGVVTIDSN